MKLAISVQPTINGVSSTSYHHRMEQIFKMSCGSGRFLEEEEEKTQYINISIHQSEARILAANFLSWYEHPGMSNRIESGLIQSQAANMRGSAPFTRLKLETFLKGH